MIEPKQRATKDLKKAKRIKLILKIGKWLVIALCILSVTYTNLFIWIMKINMVALVLILIFKHKLVTKRLNKKDVENIPNT